MAEMHSKSDSVLNKAAKTERYYTVGYATQNGRPNPPSAINLKGRWLEESGFMTGMPITVTVEWGRIVIESEINL
ncbi:type I toxin-antitoxin system SymE family toxin [Brenneria izadpanahii]|uniref:Type I toxin-antitoxin system SymE family toxin n=1 Tax=Brenneria izadpanahii TaxID=2722756 RepID=A0ABX7UUL8_9GAMM|nr:SymE family type I addiction module toxin [Brenneria izadpanahii]QTF07876.1 type I toxin-antitoxin system SymE family toxin [Brenneria izadpanahii]QTF07895.1 type I toxin-antitoxin system SymE family toxin [Brenneria izadpanahii]QTF09870.1 type I toxin-antitoxin system SymE family toxin [Brenneria izadpanahii]